MFLTVKKVLVLNSITKLGYVKISVFVGNLSKFFFYE